MQTTIDISSAPGVMKPSEAARVMNITTHRLKELLASPEVFPPGSWVRTKTGRIWIQREAVERVLNGGLGRTHTQAVKEERLAKKKAQEELKTFQRLFGN